MSEGGPVRRIVEQIEKHRAVRRRLLAKRFNERVKLIASLLNTLSAATIGAGIILPLITSGGWDISPRNVIWLLIGLSLHILANLLLGLLRSED